MKHVVVGCRKCLLGLLSLVLFVIIIVALIPETSAANVAILPPGFTSQVMVSRLTMPVAIDWASDGRMFIAEKRGVVRVFRNGRLLSTPFLDINAEVNNSGDRGMLGLALHPQFPTQPYVYLFYVYDPPGLTGAPSTPGAPDGTGARVSRLVRFEADAAQDYNVAKAGSMTILLGKNSTLANIGDPNSNDGPPSCDQNETPINDCVASDGTGHTANQLEFDNTGRWLFIGNGDNSSSSRVDTRSFRAQSLDSPSGKLMRIDPTTGAGVPSNPFYQTSNPNSTRSKIYSYGLRNPFRFAINPQTNEPFIGDVGQKTWEEINTGRGKNFGWPCYEGGNGVNVRQYGFETTDTTRATCQAIYNQGAGAIQAPLFGYSQKVGVTLPDGTVSNPGAAVVAGAFYRGTSYPAQYRDALFFGDYNRDYIQYLTFNADGSVTPNNFGQWLGGAAQITVGPDSNIWYVVFLAGEVRRFVYTASGNTPPTARITATPSTGGAPLRVQFSSAGTTDPENDALTFSWDFGDGGTSTNANPTYTYQRAGNYTAVLTVRDAANNTATANIPITVGNSAPVAKIITPTSSTTYNANQLLSYSGSASDAEDSTIPPSGLSWDLRLHHNDHVHVNEYQATGTSGSFMTPDHSDDTYLELCLTATDSGGLQDTECVSFQPKRVRYTYQTEPEGLNLMYELAAVQTPFTANSIVNAVQAVSAPPTQGEYQFKRWSDGVTDSTRSITVGTAPKTFTAIYERAAPEPTATVTAEPTATATVEPTPSPTATVEPTPTTEPTVEPTPTTEPTPPAAPGQLELGVNGYTYTVVNRDGAPVNNVSVSDTTCSAVAYVSGDTNGDGRLDNDETWTFACTVPPVHTGSRDVTVSGQSAGGSTLTANSEIPYRVLLPMAMR